MQAEPIRYHAPVRYCHWHVPQGAVVLEVVLVEVVVEVEVVDVVLVLVDVVDVVLVVLVEVDVVELVLVEVVELVLVELVLVLVVELVLVEVVLLVLVEVVLDVLVEVELVEVELVVEVVVLVLVEVLVVVVVVVVVVVPQTSPAVSSQSPAMTAKCTRTSACRSANPFQTRTVRPSGVSAPFGPVRYSTIPQEFFRCSACVRPTWIRRPSSVFGPGARSFDVFRGDRSCAWTARALRRKSSSEVKPIALGTASSVRRGVLVQRHPGPRALGTGRGADRHLDRQDVAGDDCDRRQHAVDHFAGRL